MSGTQQREEDLATDIFAAYLDALSEVDLARIAEFESLDEKHKWSLRQLFQTDPNAGAAW